MFGLILGFGLACSEMSFNVQINQSLGILDSRSDYNSIIAKHHRQSIPTSSAHKHCHTTMVKAMIECQHRIDIEC